MKTLLSISSLSLFAACNDNSDTKEDGLESKHIWTIYKSKQGELWFGGADPSGVYRFNGNSFKRKY